MFSDGSMECLRSLSDTGLWDHGLPSHQWYLPCPTMLELELPFAWHFSLIPGFHPGRQGSALNIAINSPLVDSFYHATCSLCSLFCLFPHGIWRGKENTKAHPQIPYSRKQRRSQQTLPELQKSKALWWFRSFWISYCHAIFNVFLEKDTDIKGDRILNDY